MSSSTSRLIERALAEDIGSGDITAKYFISPQSKAQALLVARQDGIIAGTEVAEEVFRKVDQHVEINTLLPDGSQVARGAIIMKIMGKAASILTAERTALNFMQRMSGVATLTNAYVQAISGTNTIILDTRKTIPGWRHLDKLAVTIGGGQNHRMGLYDRAMVKDNHLMAHDNNEELQAAILKLKADKPETEVELEADKLSQVSSFLEMTGVDYILLDNMSLEDMKSAVKMRGSSQIKLEASGGVTLDTIAAIAATGVDFISIGALTHSAKAMDLALDFTEL